ncbi:MAG TPA: tRNA-binding protein [Candidatus Acidoferrales bacterium]|nr:tRNA-binding protein [Candidatus Acidoferrales bacterium]
MPDSVADVLPEVDFATFQKLDIRSGVVLQAEPFPEARKPAIKLIIDFGPPVGIRQSSAQLTLHYSPEALVGQEVLAVVNFPPRRIAGFPSQVLVLGLLPADDPVDVILIRPDRPGTRGRRLG